MAGNLTKRIVFAVVAIPATAGVLWLGGWWLAAAIAALAVLGAREVYDLARLRGVAPLAPLGYAAAVAIPLATYGARSIPEISAAAGYAATLWLLAVLAAAMGLGPERRPLAAVGVTCFGALYASAPLAFLLAIRHSAAAPLAGFALVLLPLALTWIF